MQARGPLQPTSAAPSHGGMDPIAAGRVSVCAATRRCSQGETLRVGEGTHPLTPSNSMPQSPAVPSNLQLDPARSSETQGRQAGGETAIEHQDCSCSAPWLSCINRKITYVNPSSLLDTSLRFCPPERAEVVGVIPIIVTNGVRLLQTQLSHGEGHEARRGGPEAMPLDQHMAGRHGERQSGVEIHPDPVHDLCTMADHGQHRQHHLDEQAVLPLPALAEFKVRRIPSAAWKAVSLKTIMRSSHCRISHCKVFSATWAVAQRPGPPTG